MKKQMIFAAISILLAAISFSSCKKDNNDNTTNVSLSLFKNTNWTGEFNYAARGMSRLALSLLKRPACLA